ncbi:hypothetical protein ACA910_013909 [Epithemia clementina (nom. ined.)]
MLVQTTTNTSIPANGLDPTNHENACSVVASPLQEQDGSSDENDQDDDEELTLLREQFRQTEAHIDRHIHSFYDNDDATGATNNHKSSAAEEILTKFTALLICSSVSSDSSSSNSEEGVDPCGADDTSFLQDYYYMSDDDENAENGRDSLANDWAELRRELEQATQEFGSPLSLLGLPGRRRRRESLLGGGGGGQHP